MVFEGEVFPQLVSQPPEFNARRSAKPPADLGRGCVKVLVKHSSEQFVIVEAVPSGRESFSICISSKMFLRRFSFSFGASSASFVSLRRKNILLILDAKVLTKPRGI